MEWYSHCTAYSIHGTGQGSLVSPYIWLIVSSVLFDVHDDISFGMNLSTADGTYSLQLSIIRFVDDSRCSTSANPEFTIPEILQEMKHDAQV